ncbi:YjdF family protein [Neobittarella massiliensis]|uniref:YjdF family protein n=1 Tax=Neobittarella massiliensis (ex Bilen et al. 2018) TaxID=2041842 RepID=A0A8J6INU6_9FIRM|nr:YjdF family protein [Neobittarella massiliensis]MBC3516145.1 YjdF family protein [Neobittarella massiliensis]
MDRIECTFTVFFEDSFWVGVYQRQYRGRYQVCKVTFGAQPKDYQVYDYLLKNWHRLAFSAPSAQQGPDERRQNPKRVQRAIARQLEQTGVGTKAQQALQAQYQQQKRQREKQQRCRRQCAQQRQFALRQQKRREKHRGH